MSALKDILEIPDSNVSDLEEAVRRACESTIDVSDLETDGEKEFVKALVRLKIIAQKLSSRRVRFNRNRAVLLDTCYNETKAKKLAEALKKISDKVADDKFKKFLFLLASVYATMIKDPNRIDRLEWFPLLVRASANTGYIPICPTRGDVAALAIKLLLLGVDNITVDRSDVEFILKKLVGLTEASNQRNNQG